MIGINRKYIYGDFDNAARYINDKIIEKFIFYIYILSYCY